MTKSDFKKTAGKVIALARVAVSFTSSAKDDDVVELMSHLIEDEDHFVVLADLLGLTDDPAPVPRT